MKIFGKHNSALHLVEKDTDSAPDRHALDDIQASDPDPAKTMHIRPGSGSITLPTNTIGPQTDWGGGGGLFGP